MAVLLLHQSPYRLCLRNRDCVFCTQNTATTRSLGLAQTEGHRARPYWSPYLYADDCLSPPSHPMGRHHLFLAQRPHHRSLHFRRPAIACLYWHPSLAKGPRHGTQKRCDEAYRVGKLRLQLLPLRISAHNVLLLAHLVPGYQGRHCLG